MKLHQSQRLFRFIINGLMAKLELNLLVQFSRRARGRQDNWKALVSLLITDLEEAKG